MNMQDAVAAGSPLIAEAKRRRLAKPFVAYIAATAWHETGGAMKPVTESLNYTPGALRKTFGKWFTRETSEKYGRTKSHPADQEAIGNIAYGGRMGNDDPGDGYKFRGRGHVQLTGRDNYTLFAKRLGLDLVGNPDLALGPEVSMKILFEGMMNGLFTGHGLRRYISGSDIDFKGARRVVNGTDRADLIAKYADQFMLLLDNYNPIADSRTMGAAKATKRGADVGATITIAGGAIAAGEAILGDTDNIVGAAGIAAQLGEFMPWIAPVLIFGITGLFVWMRFRQNKIEALRKEDAEAGR